MTWWQPALAGTMTGKPGRCRRGEKKVLLLIAFMTSGMAGKGTPPNKYPAQLAAGRPPSRDIFLPGPLFTCHAGTGT